MSRRWTTLLLLPLLLGLAAAARADEPERPWYGYQTLLVDVGAVSLAAGAVALSSRQSAASGTLAGAGLATYLVGPAVVHGLGHGNGPSAGRSVVWRVCGPLVGGLAGVLIGATIDSGAHYSECAGCATALLGLGGLAGGYFTAVAVDALSLAREPAPGTPPIVLAPIWGAEHKGVVLALQF